MGEKKTRFILLGCIVTGILIVGIGSVLLGGQDVPQHTPGGSDTELQEHAAEEQQTAEENATEASETTEIVVGEEAFLAVVQETMDGLLTVSDLSAQIGENCVVTMTGSVDKAEVAALLEAQSDSISSAYQAVLQLLPDSLPLTLEIYLQTNDHTVEIVPRSLKVSSMEIPDSVVDGDMFETLQQNLNRELKKQVQQIEAITSENGELRVRGVTA